MEPHPLVLRIEELCPIPDPLQSPIKAVRRRHYLMKMPIQNLREMEAEGIGNLNEKEYLVRKIIRNQGLLGDLYENDAADKETKKRRRLE